MEGPANTVSYFAAGYIVIFGILGFYIASLVVRWRNLKLDEKTLTEIENKQ